MGIKCSYSTMNEEISFVNPYNFVDIDFSKKATDDINKIKEKKPEERLTGKIHCIIKAKTPIAVPDTEKEQPENAHKTYDFMAYPDGRHFIPASSIRGAIRSVFETVTDSCFSTTKDNTMLDERLAPTKGAKVNAGVLVKQDDGNWKLYKAERYMLKARRAGSNNHRNSEAWNNSVCPPYEPQESDKGRFITIKKGKDHDGAKVTLRDGAKVLFETLKNDSGQDVFYKSRLGIDCAPIATKIYSEDANVPSADVGYLVIGEPIFGKHHSSIFKVDTEQSQSYSADDINWAFQGLKRTLDLYNDKAINRNLNPPKNDKGLKHYGYAAFESMEKKGVIPVWYLEEESRLYFMMANIGRRAFYKTLNDHLGEKVRCRERGKLCPACRLFGTASNIGNSVGSRIRFTDAICTTELLIDERYTMLAELGKPRTSYMPFYSRDLKTYYNRKTDSGYDSEGVTIRGRKYYWHSENFAQINKNPDNPIKKTERNATMQLAQAGAEFEFDIFFDGILEPELQQLIWSLNFYENEKDGVMCHKIGRGKPIGLGSVKIYIESIQNRKFEVNDSGQKTYVIARYKINYAEDPFDLTKKKTPDYVRQLINLVNFDNRQDVHYPYVKAESINLERVVEMAKDSNALANHHWFTENKNGGRVGHNHAIQTLPEVPATGKVNNQQIYVYKAKQENKAIWIAGYNLTYQQRISAVGNQGVDSLSEWPSQTNIKNFAIAYDTILLPSRTKAALIETAIANYQHVYVAEQRNNRDNGWEQFK